MFYHAPENYVCPFCRVVQGTYDALIMRQDVVFEDTLVTAFIAPYWWPNNEGHVLIIPNEHFENLYDLPRLYAHRIQDLAQAIALAFKQVYHCHGVSTRQHNEPAGNQDVWHYHLHVFPRYIDDSLYQSFRSREIAPPEKRWAYAEKVRTFLASKKEE
ncbi:MAG TPA: HIT domain-containing protein [Ktedonobacteraceae bacterium]|nr:HIT domain-containing protein [Ktedonobacteraceae bacterium]